MLITNANRYGLTKGSYIAESLELTDDGRKAVDEGVPRREQAHVRVKLAILEIAPFQHLYERFANGKLPAKAVLTDAITDFDVPVDLAEEASTRLL